MDGHKRLIQEYEFKEDYIEALEHAYDEAWATLTHLGIEEDYTLKERIWRLYDRMGGK